ncbi:MAG: flagellar basal-body rod protein FlgG [Pirellulaceae bacterium]|nr:flagellar basal-body rod protein FlgG [Pirellulaceae bacterium]
MSLPSMYAAASGMKAAETQLNVISNNLANINTVGYKKDRANFEDLMYRHTVAPGTKTSGGEPSPTGVSLGLGVKTSSTQTNFSQGTPDVSGNPLDMAIEGRGFFKVTDPNLGTVYTRAGNFDRNADGKLVLGTATAGKLLDPEITIPPDATKISVSSDGTIIYLQPGQTTFTSVEGPKLTLFTNPDGLLKLGDNLYAETEASGTGVEATPGQEGAGKILGGMLEKSNVEPVEELIGLITTQRAFELNSQAVQAGDQILQLVSNLRR